MASILCVLPTGPWREELEAILATSGHQPFSLETIEEATALLQEISVDAIIWDVPDGYVPSEALQEELAGLEVPLLAFASSGLASREFPADVADRVLYRPILTERLDAILRETICASRQKRFNRLPEGHWLGALPYPLAKALGDLERSTLRLRKIATDLEHPDLHDHVTILDRNVRKVRTTSENAIIFTEAKGMSHESEGSAWLRSRKTTLTAALIEGLARSAASLHNREGDLHIELEDVAVAAHRRSVRHIVDELLKNAFRHSEAGTPVVVKSYLMGNRLRVEVHNHPIDQQPPTFPNLLSHHRDVFERAGKGLGLLVIASLAKLYGGSLSTDFDQEHHDVQVTVSLPVAA